MQELAAAAAVRPQRAGAPARARLHGLTGVRFFAAAWVWCYHFLVLTVGGAPFWAARVQNAGHAAVSLFFVLSGFVLAYNYAEPLAGGRVSRARFWWLRLGRVWPLYALVALLEVPLALRAGVAPGHLGAATAADLVGLQAWIPSITFVGNTPGWSVSVELFFYAIFPWLVPIAARRARGAIVACLVVALAAAAAPALVPPASGAATFLKCGPPLRLPEFILGVALGRAFLRRERALAPATATRLAVVAIATIMAVVLASGPIPRYFLHALLLPAFALLLWSVAAGAGAWLGSGPLRLLGESSYGLYLLQMPLFEAIAGKYEWHLPAMLAFFALLVVASILAHFAVERPAQRWFRARLNRVLPRRSEDDGGDLANR